MERMGTYNHILVASNLTEDSQRVADRAQYLAKRSDAKLSIVHVVEFNPMMYGGGEFAIPLDGDLEESIQNHAKQALKVEAERLGIPKEGQYLQSGTTAENLAELVNTLNVDLLVMGHHEQHWLSSMLGSTSNSVVHMMPCDVMAVHLE